LVTIRRSVLDVATTSGVARVHWLEAAGATGRPVLVLGHGAGGGVEAIDLQRLAVGVVAAGFTVALVEQPWRVAGRRLAPRPADLDEAWLQVLGRLRPRGRVVVGGRSAGARVACRTALATGAAGVVAVAFPLHPPGRPERSRAGELQAAGVPVLVLQGTRDPFGTPDEVTAAAPGVRVLPVAGGDHGLSRVDLSGAISAVRAFLVQIAE
jgi:predicted alpha/beta-hydrolase family hydrolase